MIYMAIIVNKDGKPEPRKIHDEDLDDLWDSYVSKEIKDFQIYDLSGKILISTDESLEKFKMTNRDRSKMDEEDKRLKARIRRRKREAAKRTNLTDPNHIRAQRRSPDDPLSVSYRLKNDPEFRKNYLRESYYRRKALKEKS